MAFLKTTLLLLFLFSALGCGTEPRERLAFDQQAWLAGDWTLRGRMVDDLIADSLLMGKTKSEVVALLGDQGDTICNFSYPVDIGLKVGPFGIGGTWLFFLNVHFDTLTGKVNDVQCLD